jgi:septal ring factor EnvC (AmiA/AmiB activator)
MSYGSSHRQMCLHFLFVLAAETTFALHTDFILGSVCMQSAELSKEREHLASLASQLAEKSKSLTDQEQRLSAANAELAAARAQVASTEAAAKERLAAGMLIFMAFGSSCRCRSFPLGACNPLP